MNKLLPLALVTTFAASLATPAPAHADVASDRVLLLTGGPYGCTGAIGFRRLRQSPDGAQVLETTEFAVLEGIYLEITSVEYQTPYDTGWASFYVQSLELAIRKRAGTGSTPVFSGRYQNRSTYGDDGQGNLAGVGQYVAPGADTHVAAFPSGPLMSAGGRLCLAASGDFWLFGGSLRVRGRLIAGAPAIEPTPVPPRL